MRVRVLRFGFYWGKTFSIALVMVILIQHFIFTPVKVDGASMLPTLQDGDSALLWKLGYEPRAFDVIVFEVSEGQYYVKRIIGLPGQSIEVVEDQLYVDGIVVPEPYLDKDTNSGDTFTWDFTLQEVCQFQSCEKIPPGYYLVLGDNRPLSVDSRQIGLIHENQILGHVVGAQWMDHRDN